MKKLPYLAAAGLIIAAHVIVLAACRTPGEQPRTVVRVPHSTPATTPATTAVVPSAVVIR